MRILKIVAAMLSLAWATQAAYALPPTATHDVSLVVAGSSAQRDTFLQEFTTICQAATLTVYRASPIANQDFRAYSCTLNATGIPAIIAGRNAIVYYRSEGGSVYGVGTLANDVPVKRLLVNAACTFSLSTGACPVSGYNLTTDTGTGNLVNSLVDLGVSDVEPPRFVGENWPAAGASVLGSQPSQSQFESITSHTGTGTVYGILVNSTLAVDDLSRQDVTAIFTGQYGTWDQVAAVNNSGDASGEITVCRREPGSGAQAAASIYFNEQGCPVGYPFVTAPMGPIFDNPVIQNSTSTTLNSCVAGNAGSIGMQIYTVTPPAGTKWVTINGKAPNKVVSALGDYDFWFESTFNRDSVIFAKPRENALAEFLIARARNAAVIPANDSAFALYSDGINVPTIPVSTSRPIALGTRSAIDALGTRTPNSSCLRALGVF